MWEISQYEQHKKTIDGCISDEVYLVTLKKEIAPIKEPQCRFIGFNSYSFTSSFFRGITTFFDIRISLICDSTIFTNYEWTFYTGNCLCIKSRYSAIVFNSLILLHIDWYNVEMFSLSLQLIPRPSNKGLTIIYYVKIHIHLNYKNQQKIKGITLNLQANCISKSLPKKRWNFMRLACSPCWTSASKSCDSNRTHRLPEIKVSIK